MGAIVGVAVAIWGMNVFSNYGFESVISLQAVEIACGVALGWDSCSAYIQPLPLRQYHRSKLYGGSLSEIMKGAR